MTENKKGLWEKLFGEKKSCCAVRIEPLDDEADRNAEDLDVDRQGAKGHGDSESERQAAAEQGGNRG